MTCDTPYIFQASPVASPVVLLAGRLKTLFVVRLVK